MTYYKFFIKQKKSKYIIFLNLKNDILIFLYFLILNINKILQKQTIEYLILSNIKVLFKIK